MQVSGNIEKMKAEGIDPVKYHFRLNEQLIPMNELVGSEIKIQFEHKIHCVSCGKLTKKPYGQGFCYICFSESPDNAECIVRPELCEGHLGKGRDPQWEFDHHVKEHFVYLAQSGGIKVGVTRSSQIPTRWIDQGAVNAILLAKTPYRKLAGMIEVALKNHYSDKTNWQQMLKNDLQNIDLKIEKNKAAELLSHEFKNYVLKDTEVMHIQYPVQRFPDKIQSLSLDKEPIISGLLSGIKGQYLIFNDGRVFNVRSHSGYQITIMF